MDKSDILGKAKREANKRACMVDMTIQKIHQMYISCTIFHQIYGGGHRGRAGWKVSPILIKGTPHYPIPCLPFLFRA